MLNETSRKLALLNAITIRTLNLKVAVLLSFALCYIEHLSYLTCVRRKGIVSFIARLGRTSASKMAPVETGLQSLELLFTIGLGVGFVLCFDPENIQISVK